MNRLIEMDENKLASEIKRLEAGDVGVGFNKDYTKQCVAIVKKELKSRKPKA